MKVSVEKRGGRWILRWKPPGQKRQSHWPQPPIFHRTIAEQEAKRFAEQFAQDRPKPKIGFRPADAWTIAETADRWYHAHAQRGYAWGDSRAVARLSEVFKVELVRDLTVDLIRAYRREGHAETTLWKLRRVLEWAQAERQEVGQSVLKELQPKTAGRRATTSEADVELLTDDQVGDIEKVAERHEQAPLIHCLTLYGWRPLTANLMLVRDLNLTASRPTATLIIKGHSKPYIHPLSDESVRLLRPLTKGRHLTARLFLNWKGDPWRATTTPDGLEVSATQMAGWYRRTCRHLAPLCGNIYALKRYAITRMFEGRPPWTERLTPRQIRLFTGHKTDSQVMRYLRADITEAHKLLGGNGGNDGEMGSTMIPNDAPNRAEVILFPRKSSR